MLILRGIGFLFDIGGACIRPLFFLILKIRQELSELTLVEMVR
jgi:hypothetical protein